MQVSFTVIGEPKGKQRPRVVHTGGRTMTYTPGQTVMYENLVRLEYIRCCEGKRFADDAQLKMNVDAYYSIPKSTSKRRRQMMIDREIRPTKKPDSSNVLKAIEDALNGVAYKDDAQIVETRISRFYAEQARVDVTLTEI